MQGARILGYIIICMGGIKMIDVEKLTQEALNGSYSACSTLAEAYYLGKEIEEDNDKAFYWFQKALGFSEANTDALLLYRVGKCYFHGYGISEDVTSAYKYFKQSADLGNPEAGYYTGWCLVLGRGVESNIENGVYYLDKAAKAGDDDALTMLFQLYDDSDYVEADDAKYLHYLKMGVERNVPRALTDWGFCLTSGDKGIQVNMDEGIDALKKASDLGQATASKNLGKILGFGQGVPVDRELGEKYIRKAMEQGDEDAIDALGALYTDMAEDLIGEDSQESFDRAGAFLQKAIDEGYDAYGELGELYLYGYLKDPYKDYIEKAVELFDKTTDERKLKLFTQMSNDLKQYRNDYNNLHARLQMYMTFFAGRKNRDAGVEWQKYRERMLRYGVTV